MSITTENDLYNNLLYSSLNCQTLLHRDDGSDKFKKDRIMAILKRIENIKTAFEFEDKAKGDAGGYKLKADIERAGNP